MARIVCRLRIVLAERNMTRVKLSAISGIPLNTLAPLYHDKWQRVDRKTIDRICTALNITYRSYLRTGRNKETFSNSEINMLSTYVNRNKITDGRINKNKGEHTRLNAVQR